MKSLSGAGLALLLIPATLLGVERVVFTKVFPGSDPAYLKVTVDSTGAADYREDPDDDRPLRFTIPDADVQRVFTTAAKLDHFKTALESPAKVAKMGVKTFRFEKDGSGQETTFNYTENLDARELLEWFERASETARARSLLERATKYDKLGVNQALLYVQTCWEKKRLVAAPQLLPLLDRVSNNDAFLNMARNRAAALAAQIRAEEAKPTP